MTILDTNVVSEVMASSPSRVVLAWLSKVRSADDLFITSITVGEILYGIELLPLGKRRDKLSRDAEEMFAGDFSARILVFDDLAARAFAQIAATRRKRGRPIDEFDAQIAAIASVHGAVLATRNSTDFEHCGVRLINPWE